MLMNFYENIRILTLAVLSTAIWFTSGCGSSSDQPRAVNPTGPPTATQSSAAAAYENKIVRRPGNTVEDGKVYLIERGKKRWVINASWLTSHGYHFPEDVMEIPATALDAIPAGEPVQ